MSTNLKPQRRHIPTLDALEGRIAFTAPGTLAGPVPAAPQAMVTSLRVRALADGDVDILATPTGQKIQDYFARFAVGNRGSSRLDSLTLNGPGGIVNASATITIAHSWGKVLGKEISVQKTFIANATYDMVANTMSGSFDLGEVSLSAKVGGRTFSISLGRVVIDAEFLRQILDGDVEALVQQIPNPIPTVFRTEHRNDYNSVVAALTKKYGKGNFYFASTGFVDWASPERFTVAFARSIAGDVTAIPALMKQVQSRANAELNAIVSFATKKGAKDAKKAVQNLLAGKAVKTPNLDILWRPVKYETRTVTANRITTPWVAISHGGFAIIWHK